MAMRCAGKAKGCVADSPWRSKHYRASYHTFIKRHKMRIERRRAKRDPECIPGYGRYDEYET